MAFVHIQGGISGTGSAILTLTNNPGQGNLVCFGYLFDTTAGVITSIVDSNGNPYSIVTTTDSEVVGLAFLLNAPANASKTIFLNFTGSPSFYEVWGDEFSCGTSTVFDNVVAASGNAVAGIINTPVITPKLSGGELLYSLCSPNVVLTAPGLGVVYNGWTGTAIDAIYGTGGEYILSANSPQAVAYVNNDPTGAYTAIAMAFSEGQIAPSDMTPGCNLVMEIG